MEVLALVVPVQPVNKARTLAEGKSHPGHRGIPGLIIFAFLPALLLVKVDPADNGPVQVPDHHQPALAGAESLFQGDPAPGGSGGFFLPKHTPAGDAAPQPAGKTLYRGAFSRPHRLAAIGEEFPAGQGQFAPQPVQALPQGKAHPADVKNSFHTLAPSFY